MVETVEGKLARAKAENRARSKRNEAAGRRTMGHDFQFPRDPDWDWLKASYPGNVLLRADCQFVEAVSHLIGRMAYLSTPYTKAVVNDQMEWDRGLSCDIEVRTARWVRAFAIEGITGASPILLSCAACHADIEDRLDPLDDVFWARWRRPLLSASGAVVIPAMDGWDVSQGVWRDACWALLHNVPVYLIAKGSEFGADL
jgi:hypothetical protein